MSPETQTLLQAILAPPAPAATEDASSSTMTVETILGKINDLQKCGALLSDALMSALSVIDMLPKSDDLAQARINLLQTGMWAERAIVGDIHDYAEIARKNPKG